MALLGSIEQHEAQGVEASSNGPGSGSAEAAFDEDPGSVWVPDRLNDASPTWSITFAEPLLIEKIGLTFATPDGSPVPIARYAVEALWEGRWLRLGGAQSNRETEVEHTLPSGFATTELRIRFERDEVAGLAEVRVTRADLLPPSAGSFVDGAPLRDGAHTYEIAAVDRYGAYGPWSPAGVEVDRLSKPTGLVGLAEGSDVVLSWNSNPEPNLDHYVVYRFGEIVGTSTDPAYRDPGLANGDYLYAVRAVDTSGNESELSDPATVTVAVQPPAAPVLQAVATPQGYVHLAWIHPGAARYVLSRSTVGGGAKAPLVTVTEAAYLDVAVAAGVEYFYVVAAQDAVGNPSPGSNEASATPQRTEAPAAPVIFFPTDAAHPIVRHTRTTAVRGRTEPGTVVSLTDNGTTRGSTSARPPFVTDALVTFTAAPLQAVVSPDGRQVAHQIAGLGSASFRVQDLGTAVVSDVTASLDPSSVLLRFSPEGKRLLYLAPGAPADQLDLRFLDLESGDTTSVEEGPQHTYAADWSLDGSKIAYATADGGACHLLVRDLGTDTTFAFDLGDECALDPRFSPDGSRIVFVAPTGSDTEVRLLTLGGAAPAVVASAAQGARFAPDGRILFLDLAGGRIRSYDPDSGLTRDLSDGSTAPFDLAVDPRGLWFSTQESVAGAVRVAVTSLQSGERRVLAETAEGPRLHAWSDDGSLLLAPADGREVAARPGYASFAFAEIALRPGPHLLVAQAHDPASGLSGPGSEPVQVTVPAEIFPDPAVSVTEMGTYPAAPRVGQPATLWARVRNLGSEAARAVSVRLRLVDATGAPVTETTVVLALLPAGASTVVAQPWVPAASGSFGLSVIVDAEDALIELSEDNNEAARDLFVPDAAGLVANVDADRPSYPSHAPALVTVRLANGKGAMTGVARLTVDAVAGGEAAVVDERALSLAYGETTEYTVGWNTGKVYAGDYVFRLRVLEAGAVTASAARAFVLQPDVKAKARLVADRFTVERGEAATFAATVRNEGENAALEGLLARFSVRPQAPGAVVYEADTPLGVLLSSGAQIFTAAWPQALPAGAYLAELRVLRSGSVLALASAPFEVTASLGRTTGTLAAKPGHVLQGDPFTTPLSVTNAGNAALAAYPVVVEVVSGPEPTVWLTQSLIVDLAVGETRLAAPAFSSAPLPPGEYVLRLRGGSSPASLARANFRVHGLVTPPSIDAPADGSVVDTHLPVLTVNNGASAEGAALTYEFAMFVDEALTAPLPGTFDVAETPARTSWAIEDPLSEDATYWWRARASDGFSRSAWSAVARFRVDAANQPPDAPVPDSPRGNVTVAASQPALVVRNALDIEHDLLSYEFRLGSDEALTVIVASITGVNEGQGLTSWLVPVGLLEDTRYCWISRAHDAKASSAWSLPACFVVSTENAAPTAPVPLRPILGAEVATLMPELVVGPAHDAEGTALTYRFEADRTPSFGSADLQASPDLPGGTGEIAWTPPVALVDNTAYFWRAAASDGVTQGPWAYASFFVNLGNDAPTAPILLDPVDGVTVTTATPVLLWRNASDADGDALRYDVEVKDARGLVVAATAGLAEAPDQTSWTLSVPLAENETFEWRARAKDAETPGPWSAPAKFHVNALRQAPTAPTPVVPAEGALVLDRHPALVVANATSPDGLGLTYTFELFTETGLVLTLVEAVQAQPEGSSSTTWTPSPALPNAAYAWRVRAFDGELYGPWSPTARFQVAVDEPPSAPLGLVATPDEAKVRLAWQPSVEPDVVGYRVYRGLAPGGPYAKIADVTTAAHVDTGLTNGVTYYYVVTARDQSHESARSNEAAATPFASPTVIPAEVSLAPETVAAECLVSSGCRCHEDDDRASREADVHVTHDDDDEGCPRYVIARIELPPGRDPTSIDLATVRLAGTVPADPHYRRTSDWDHDGRSELEVRFAFEAVVPLLHAGTNTLAVTGKAAGTPFLGSDTIVVASLEVELEITPRTLKRSGSGSDVQADLELPECLSAASISVSSLRLNETVPVKKVVSTEGNKLKVKFDRAKVAAVLKAGNSVEVRVSGLAAGLSFVARDHIKVTE